MYLPWRVICPLYTFSGVCLGSNIRLKILWLLQGVGSSSSMQIAEAPPLIFTENYHRETKGFVASYTIINNRIAQKCRSVDQSVTFSFSPAMTFAFSLSHLPWLILSGRYVVGGSFNIIRLLSFVLYIYCIVPPSHWGNKNCTVQ